MKQTYLITGGTGFIGANLIRKLLTTNTTADIHILLRDTSVLWRLENILNKITIHHIHITQKKIFKKTIQDIKPDYIFHLASYGSNDKETDLYEMITGNILFSSTLLDAINPYPYSACVIVGSSSEYGFQDTPMKETTLLKPASFYAATKASVSHIATVYKKQYKKPITIVRPFSVFGPFEASHRLVPTVILKCIKNLPIALTPGEEKRDFIYIDDFVDSMLLSANTKKQTLPDILNIGSGKEISTREIVTVIHKHTKSSSPLLWGQFPNRIWDTNAWQADISLAKKELSWKPKYTLTQGIKATISWFAQNRFLYEKQ